MRRTLALITLLFLTGILFMPLAAAQERQTGGTITVAEDETVEGMTAVGGTITVDGTVDGDLTAVAGDIRITGDVTGDVTAAGGSITLVGDVGGDMSAFGGGVHLAENSSVGQRFESGAGDVSIHGVVGGDARVQADNLRIGPTADIGGNLEHATRSLSLSNDASVLGEIQSVDRIEFTQIVPVHMDVPGWAFPMYGFVINLVLGSILLLLLPRFSYGMVERILDTPLFSLLIGALTMFVAPVLIGLLLITIIGIPIALLGLLILVIALWAGTVYGGFAIGAALLQPFDVTNRWAMLVFGLFVVLLLSLLPFVGGFIYLLITLLGFGALVLGARR